MQMICERVQWTGWGASHPFVVNEVRRVHRVAISTAPGPLEMRSGPYTQAPGKFVACAAAAAADATGRVGLLRADVWELKP